MVKTSKDGRTIIGDSWSELGIDANESRGKQKTLCPNCSHSRKPENRSDRSLSVDAVNGLANCHNCGINYVIDRYKGNIAKVESTKNYKLPKQEINYDISKNVAEYFKGRGISLETLKKLKITSGKAYMPQINKEAGTINFNYFFNDTLVNVKYRDGRKNFKLESGAKLIFFNLDCLLDRELDSVVIVEGEIDAASYVEAGVSNVISVPNGASKGSMNLEYLTNSYELFDNSWRTENGYRPLSKIVIATDDDDAGEALKSELTRRLGEYRCYGVDLKGCNDPNELLIKEGKVALYNTFDMAEPIPMKDITEAKDLAHDIFKMREEGGLKPGAQVGSENFRELFSADRARLTVITGVPTHGKTVFLDDITVRLAVEHNWVTALFSPESFPIELHVTRLMSKLIGKHFNEMTHQEITMGLEFVNKHFVWIYPDEDYSLRNILNITRDAVRRYGVNSLVIDPWTEIDKGGLTNTEDINDHLSTLNQFKRAEDLHIFLVAHPTKMQKDPETKKVNVPDLYDISGSANFYNKADFGITVYRNFEGQTVEIYVNKCKFEHLGKQGVCVLRYNVKNGRYQSIEDINKDGWDSRNWLSTQADQQVISPNLKF
jgi:twinkle protein